MHKVVEGIKAIMIDLYIFLHGSKPHNLAASYVVLF